MGSGFCHWETSEGGSPYFESCQRKICAAVCRNRLTPTCGCYGHLLKDCSIKKPMEKVVVQPSGDKEQLLQEGEKSDSAINQEPNNQDIPDNDQVKENLHGELINAIRNKRPNKTGMGAKNKEPTNQGSGNRYDALLREKLKEEILKSGLREGQQTRFPC